MSEMDFKFKNSTDCSNLAKLMPLNAILVVTKRFPKPFKFLTNGCDLHSVSHSQEHVILKCNCMPVFLTAFIKDLLTGLPHLGQ